MTHGDRAVFLDRDGVLNALVERDGRRVSPRTLADFRLLPGVRRAAELLREHAMLVFVITNQPDLARGRMDPSEHAAMMAVVDAAVRPAAMLVCPHDDTDACACRKPRPGMLVQAAQQWGIDLRRSVVVGDSWRDIEAGATVGCRTILVGPGDRPGLEADATVADVMEAAHLVARWITSPDGGHA